jgi:hypothetical protein
MLSPEQREQLAEKVRREREEQGLPERVEDPAALRRIAALLVAEGVPHA